jgi:hypothetical protein
MHLRLRTPALSIAAALLLLGALAVLAGPAASAAPAAGLRVSLSVRTLAPGGSLALRVRPASSRCRLALHFGTSRGRVTLRRRVPRSGRLVLARVGRPGRRTVVVRCGRRIAKAAFFVREGALAPSTPDAQAPTAGAPGTPGAPGTAPVPGRSPSGAPAPPASGQATPPAPAPAPAPAPPAFNPWADTTRFTWQTVRSAPGPRLEAQGAAVGGRLFVFGGFTTEAELDTTARSDAYEPASDTWRRVADLPDEITHAPAVVDGTTIWLLGGYSGDHPGPATERVWKYSVTTNAWSAGPPLPAARGAGAAAILGRQLHFFGGTSRNGRNGNPDQGDHWVLPLDGGSGWQARAPMPNPRNHLAGAALGGRVYAIGGQYEENELTGNQRDVHAYDPGTDRWTQVASLPSPRGHISASAIVVGGRIVVIGGTEQGSRPSSAVTVYDPGANAWSALPKLPQGRKTPVADIIGNDLYVATGSFRLSTLRGRFQP